MVWQGAIVDIPEFWTLCDGNNGTPDLRDQMVIGSQGTYVQDETGGSEPHTHTFTGDGHFHIIGDGTDINRGSGFNQTIDPSSSVGTTDPTLFRPVYYSLAFIMFIGA